MDTAKYHEEVCSMNNIRISEFLKMHPDIEADADNDPASEKILT